MESSDLEAVKANLRESRIKDGVDYAFVFKYGKLSILCHYVFKESIEEEIRKAGF